MTSIDQFRAILAQARPRAITVSVCLRGDLAIAYENAMEEAVARTSAASGDDRLGNSEAKRRLIEIERLKADVLANSVDLVIEQMKPADYQALTLAHPPRTLEDGSPHPDDMEGVNRETFSWALIGASCAKPKLSAEDLAQLQEASSPVQAMELWTAALRVNRHDVPVPQLRASSATTLSSEPG